MKERQALFSMPVKDPSGRAFGDRLREAFKGAGNSEIARQLGLTPSTLTNYMNGRIPPPETLLAISHLTNCSIHWLITGQGEESFDRLGFLDERTRAAIITIASKRRVTPEAFLSDLIGEGLRELAVELIRNQSELNGAGLDELFALLKLFGSTGVEAVASETAAETTKRHAGGE